MEKTKDYLITLECGHRLPVQTELIPYGIRVINKIKCFKCSCCDVIKEAVGIAECDGPEYNPDGLKPLILDK